MAGKPGVSAKVFNALGQAAVNVRAIAQGASERNISVVVDGRQATRALRATHASFYLSPNTLSIGVIGPGTVGRVLLDQLASQQARLSREFKLDLRVRGIMTSKRMFLSDRGVDLAHWKTEFESAPVPTSLTRFVEHVKVDYLPHTVIIDCSADSSVAKHYADWLAQGIHIVHAQQESQQRRDGLLRIAARSAAHWWFALLYEGTVGAGPASDPDAARPA